MVTALNDVELEKARKLLDESLIQEVIPIPSDADNSIQSLDEDMFRQKQEQSKALKVFFKRTDENKSIIQLVGVKDAVMNAKEATGKFIESKREKT